MADKMKITCYCFFIFLPLLTMFPQSMLQLINKNGTENDSIYNSRISLNSNSGHLYHSLTGHKYFNYIEYVPNERTAETYIHHLDEFERNRLENKNSKLQSYVLKHWEHGYFVTMPLIAENPTDSSYLFAVGKYNFSNQSFPLIIRPAKSQILVNSENILLDSLQKEDKQIKEPKYTCVSGAALIVIPTDLPLKNIDIQIPSADAEQFKTNVINQEYYVKILVDFKINIRKGFSEPALTEDFNMRKNAFGYSSSPQQAKESYLYTGQKPIEVVHFLELFYELKGFRIFNKDNAVLFEWMSENVVKGSWFK